VSRHWEIQVGAVDPDESGRRFRVAPPRPITPVEPHLVSVQDRSLLLRTRHQHGERRIGYHATLALEGELQVVEPGSVRSDKTVDERAWLTGCHGVAAGNPAVMHLIEAALDLDWIINGQAREREAHLELPTAPEGVRGGPRRQRSGSDGTRVEPLRRAQKRHISNGRYD
jgi:hypothetical protein